MAEENINNTANAEESEVDILELGTKLWNQRRKLIKWSICGAVIGLVIAFSIPREYNTTVKLAPETTDQKANKGGLGALASMAGINVGAGSGVDAVYPMLYPDVVSSVPFITSLFDVEVETKEGQKMTVQQFMDEENSSPWWSYIFGLPGKVIGLMRSSDDEDADHKLNTFQLTQSEDLLVTALRNRISTSVDTKTSVVTIDVQMQDPVVSAMLADTVVSRLQNYITAYRTDKARQDLKYAERINQEAREDYYKAQQRYADYLDRNQGLAFRSAETVKERLANEASLAFNLYNQTAQQVQTAQAKVQETTPVYAIITPATVPVKPSSPRKALILVGFTFLAFVACAAWILFGKPAMQNYKERINTLQGATEPTAKNKE